MSGYAQGGRIPKPTDTYTPAGIVHYNEHVTREWIEDGPRSGWALVHYQDTPDGNTIRTVLHPDDWKDAE